MNEYIPVLYACMYCELSHGKSIYFHTLASTFTASSVLLIHNMCMYIQDGDSALMEAVLRGDNNVIEQLIKLGSDLNLQNIVGQ